MAWVPPPPEEKPEVRACCLWNRGQCVGNLHVRRMACGAALLRWLCDNRPVPTRAVCCWLQVVGGYRDVWAGVLFWIHVLVRGCHSYALSLSLAHALLGWLR